MTAYDAHMGVNDTGETIEQRLERLRLSYRMERRFHLPAVEDVIIDVNWLIALVEQNIVGENLADQGSGGMRDAHQPGLGFWRCYNGHLTPNDRADCYCGLRQPGLPPREG
jgi:hypothetical protein